MNFIDDDPSNDFESKGWDVADIVSHIIYGFLEETVGAAMGETTQCANNTANFYTYFYDMKDAMKAGNNTKILDVMALFLQNIDPSFESCIWMTSEYYESFLNYGESFKDGWKVLYNFAYHFGSLFDTTTLIGNKISSTDKFSLDDFTYLGQEVGGLFYYIFYDINDYQYPDIDIDYPEEFEL